MADPLKIPGPGMRPTLEVRPTSSASMPSAPLGAQDVKSFREVLTETISEVQRLQTEADTTIKQIVSGELEDVSEAMIAIERADVSFQTMMTVRNKVMTAYEEIMRMQI